MQNALDAPEREEDIGETEKRFIRPKRFQPIVESREIYSTQMYTSGTYSVEPSPALFARAVKHDDDHLARFDPHRIPFAIPNEFSISFREFASWQERARESSDAAHQIRRTY
jgi:hypothetical protein